MIQQIDAMGGSVAAIEEGFMQEAIAKSAYEYQRQIETNEKIIVGVNKFLVDLEEPVPPFKIDDSIRVLQSDKLKDLRNRRNAAVANECLQAISKASKTNENLMPLVIAAVEAKCTLGEIADVLRKEFGEYKG